MAPRAGRPRMADYGVPDDPDGLLPWAWAEERLSSSRNYWVSTVSAAGRPHAMPVWGVWLPSRERFWFGCAPTARKARNLRAVPWVVVAPTDTVEVVSLEGRAVEVTGSDLSPQIDAFLRKYGAEMDMTRAESIDFLVGNASFEVVPHRAFGVIERPDEFAARATRWSWDAERARPDEA